MNLPSRGCFGVRTELLQVAAQSKYDFFRVEHLSCVVSGTMLGAASALYTREGLQGVYARDVLSRIESEIFVAHQRWNPAEAFAFQKDGRWAQRQVQMLGVRNQRKKNRQRQRVQPPHRLAGGALLCKIQAAEIGDHQREDEPGDDAGFRRDLAQPHRTREETPDEQAGYRDCDECCPHRDEVVIVFTEAAIWAIEIGARTRSRYG